MDLGSALSRTAFESENATNRGAMASDQTHVAQQWRGFVESRLRGGATREEIIRDLAPHGWNEETGRQLVYWVEDQIRDQLEQEAKRAAHWGARKWHMLCGALIFLLGAGLTLMSYFSSRPGERFSAWVAAMVVGVAQFLFGLLGGTRLR
jgi:hypothetical protein